MYTYLLFYMCTLFLIPLLLRIATRRAMLNHKIHHICMIRAVTCFLLWPYPRGLYRYNSRFLSLLFSSRADVLRHSAWLRRLEVPVIKTRENGGVRYWYHFNNNSTFLTAERRAQMSRVWMKIRFTIESSERLVPRHDCLRGAAP